MASGATPVHIRTVASPFHAKVIAARLGAEGIATQLRGNLEGPYPFGEVSVWVAAADWEDASELLLADEVEAAFIPHPDDEEPPERRRRPLLFGLTGRQLVAAASVLLLSGAGTVVHILF